VSERGVLFNFNRVMQVQYSDDEGDERVKSSHRCRYLIVAERNDLRDPRR
jgi:hypothetical protein